MRGTVDNVVRDSGIATWEVTSGDPIALARQLEGMPGIDMVVPFGNTLHVSGLDAAALEQAIAPFRADPGSQWIPAEPGLEDVFIALMMRTKDELQ